MKLGLSEVILLLVIGVIILFVIRGSSVPRKATRPPPRVRRPSAAEIEEERIKSGRRSRLRVFGGGLMLVGVLLLASILKVFNIVFVWYSGAALLVLAGIFVLYLSFRR